MTNSGIIDARAQYRAAARLLRGTALCGLQTFVFFLSHSRDCVIFYHVHTSKCTVSSSLTHSILTTQSRVLLKKLTGFQLVKKFPTLYGTRRFIIAFTAARHLLYPQSRSEVSVHDSQQNHFLRRGVVDTSPNPQAGGPPLVGCPRLFIQYIRRYPPYWSPFF